MNVAPVSFETVLAAASLAWVVAWLWLRRWRPMRLVTVIDGDTFVAVDMKGKRRRLRLRHVDCPELSQRNGGRAKGFVIELVRKRVVDVRLVGRDRYRRHLCDVRVDKRDLAHALAGAGLGFQLGGGLSIYLAALGARLRGLGVYSGLGQAKPWQAFSRGPLGRLLHPLFRKRR